MKLFRLSFIGLSQSLIALVLLLLLTSCGFTLRQPADFPTALHQLTLLTPNPYSRFSTQLTHLLNSMAVTVSTATSTTRSNGYILEFTQVTLSHDQPQITTSNQGITYTYTLTTTFNLRSPKGTMIYGPLTLNTSQAILVNADQIYSNTAQSIVQPELENRMINLVYDHLTSTQVKGVLQHAPQTTATHHPSKRQARTRLSDPRG